MSLDLYREDAAEALSALAPVQDPEPGTFDGFLLGAGLTTMRGFALAGRAIDIAGAVGPILQDKLLGTETEAQDRYFKEHDDVFGSAADYWTPRPGEVGIAAEITGMLLSTLPLVIASPGLAVTTHTFGTAEDLMKKGVDWKPALATGLTQGVGLGLGVWMPILGQNLWQRVLLGGAGFNVAQGIAMRGAGQVILEGTKTAEEFKAFDGTQLTLDVLLGAAFGSLVHLNPAARAQGAEFWERIRQWGETLEPSQVQALATLRQAQHLNVDSVPGKLTEPADVEAHVQRVRTAIDQLEKGQPVNVDDMPAPKMEPDTARYREATAQAKALEQIAETVRVEEGIDPLQPDILFHGTRTKFEQFGTEYVQLAEQNIAKAYAEYWRMEEGPPQLIAVQARRGRTLNIDDKLTEDVWERVGAGELNADDVIRGYAKDARDRGFRYVEHTHPENEAFGLPEHKVTISLFPKEDLLVVPSFKTAEAPAAPRGAAEPPPPRGSRGGEAAGAEAPPDLLTAEARAFAEQNAELKLRVGTEADGQTPITRSVKDFVADSEAQIARARDDAKLLSVAAQCLMGIG